jgi:uncharacterized protein YbaP (TraB family)
MIDRMSAAWAGRPARDGDRHDRRHAQDHPGLLQGAAGRRNTAWAKTIAERLKGSGVSFIAVGAGHLVGSDSVQAELAELGIKTERR